MAILARHSWPGNVRELQNLIERSVILSKGAVLNGSLPEVTNTRLSAPVTMEEAERSHVLQTLQRTGGVLGGPNGAAARLGLPRTTLIAKMKRLRINRGQDSRLPAGATASVPPIRIPPPSATTRGGAGAENSNPHPDVGRVYGLAEA